ncbi:MAG: hypothetical protein SF182_03705 [Deltaproteobacteria bacterium]|nr:hypothetical protein [Deltaproteobacteria bacterium]
MTAPSLSPPATAANGAPPRRRAGLLVLALVLFGGFALLVLIGRAEDARQGRILGWLDPLFLWLRTHGADSTDWLENHPFHVGGAISAVSLAALALLLRAGRAGLPGAVAWMALLAVSWGQILLLEDYTLLGSGLYAYATALAFGLGIWRPMHRLPGFPPFPPDAAPLPAGDAWRPTWRSECAILAAIIVVALITRTWALTEQSDFLDLEVVDSFVQAHTWHGFKGYLRFTFLATNPGTAHIPVQYVVFNLFGTSIFTLRMAAVLWGTAGVPLMYLLVRRIAGPAPAVVSAVVMALAPDQLFWSRSENGFFAPVPVLALGTVNVGLWMVQRFSPAAVAVAALLMPLSRTVYTTCLAMFLFPIGMAAHAALFARGLWKRLWYVVPLLAVGLVAWVFWLSFMMQALAGGPWKFVHPASIYGGSAWTKQGDFADAGPLDLIKLQATSIAEHMVRVAKDNAYKTTNGFSHWYMRAQVGDHPTVMHVALTALLVLGLAYMLAQVYDRRAFALLAWMVLALLPGVMSRDAAPRRMSMVFLVAQAMVGIMCAVLMRTTREARSQRAARLTAAALAVTIALVAVTNAVSHYRMPLQPVIFGDYLRVLRPVFEKSNAFFLNLPIAFRDYLVFGDAERFERDPPAFQPVAPNEWLRYALVPRSDFSDAAYKLLLTEPQIAAARDAHTAGHVSFIFFVDQTSQAQVDLVSALYPQAERLDYTSPRDNRHIVALTIAASDAEALRRPALRVAGAAPPDILRGVALTRVEGAPADGAALSITGGIRLDTDGWYRLTLDPTCAAATLQVSGQPPDGEALAPMTAGVRPFTLTLPSLDACPLPLRLLLHTAEAPAGAPLPPERFTAPAVTAVPAALAPPVVAYPGYAAPKPLAQLTARPLDLAFDGAGTVHVLLEQQQRYRIQKLTPQGAPAGEWPIEGPYGRVPSSLDVDAAGNVMAMFSPAVVFYDAAGTRTGGWSHQWLVWESEVAFFGRDLVLVSIPHRDSIAVFRRNGELLREFTTFEGGAGRLFSPTALRVGPDGRVLVVQADGQAVLFQSPLDDFQPRFVESFASDPALSAAFDGPDRMLLAFDGVVRGYDASGTRLMAETPARDLAQRRYGREARLRARDGRVYVLDPEGVRLWVIDR